MSRAILFGRRPNLFWRIYGHGLLLLLVVGLAVLAAAALAGPAPHGNAPQRYAAFLATRIAASLDDPNAVARELREQGEAFGVALSLYRQDGTLVASNVEPPLAPLGERELARLGVEPIHVHRRGRVGAAAVIANGERFGYLVGRFQAAHGQLSKVVFAVLAVLAALAIGSVPLARAIARPLASLTDIAQRIGSGDLSVRSGIRRSDEVGRLAAAIDEMADRIERLLRNERELLANVSHELRTPLARIRVALEIAQEGDGERARQGLAELGADLAELERLLEDVFATARLDLGAGGAGELPTRMERLSMREVIERAAERFRAAHPDRSLETAIDGDLPETAGDASLLRRALENLLDNARKYSESEHPVRLSAKAAAGEVVVEISDRGIGIETADLQRIFEPFFRTDRSRARGTGGVGLGLALTRRIVEAHGGTVRVESTPGKGTTVQVVLPAEGRQ